MLLLFCGVTNASTLVDALFGQKPNIDIRLSPDGNAYLISSVSVAQSRVDVYDSASQSVKYTVDLASVFDENTLLRDIKWLDNQYIATVLIDKEEVESTLLERNSQTRLVIIDVNASADSPIIYEVSTPGRLIEAAPQQAGIFYFSRTSRKSKVYKIEVEKLLKVGQKRSKLTRVDGGQFVAKNVVVEIDGFAIRWFFESSGRPEAVVYFAGDGDMQLALLQQEEQSATYAIEVLKTWDESAVNFEQNAQEDTQEADKQLLLLPIAKVADERTFYAIDFHADDALNLFKVDYETDQYETVYSSDGVPIKDLIFSADKEAIGVVVVEEGMYKERYFDRQPLRNVSQRLEFVRDQSVNAQTSLVYREAHNEPGSFWLEQQQAQPVEVLRHYSKVPEPFSSRQIVDKLLVNGAQIPYILTLPEGATDNSPAPLILMPHGGPFDVFDTPYFDPITQFFAANGYAVLRVNFQGSGGYGLAHRDAGKKQWGKNMLLEIFAATQKVQALAYINAKNTCVVGMSYGGYASLMLALKHPDLFACAVSIAGVTDVNLFLKGAYINTSQQRWLKEYVGDPYDDYDELYAISPLYQIEQLRVPLLLIHGAKDERVSVEHAFRLKLIMEQTDVAFEWELFEEADHHFAEDDQRVRLFQRVLSYVNEQLAGSQ
jgi:dipeptidyl aminopeptidase/acylaminoacyl peptidase